VCQRIMTSLHSSEVANEGSYGGLSADCRICDHKKYDLKLRWLKNNKTQNSSIKAAIKTLYHDAERKEKRNILSCYSNFLLLNAWNPPYL
jgi:hypothetical protein